MYDSEASGRRGTDTSLRTGTVKHVRAEIFTHSAGNGGARVIGLVISDRLGHAVNVSNGGTGFATYIEIPLAPS